MNYKTWVEISKNNLINNLKQFKKLVEPKVRLMAVVKSNAYGHGLLETARIIVANKSELETNKSEYDSNNSVWFGVDSIDEGLKLRKAKIKSPILILGCALKSQLEEAVRNNLRLTVYNPETIEALGKLKNKVNVHIKLETGTYRQGVQEKNFLEFIKLIKKYPKINIEGLSTHYANIEDTTYRSYAQKQLRAFQRIIKLLEKNQINIPIKHTSCSAATILFPETHFDMVRVGISMYGLWPSRETYASAMSNQFPPLRKDGDSKFSSPCDPALREGRGEREELREGFQFPPLTKGRCTC